jgi:hypothetical protein
MLVEIKGVGCCIRQIDNVPVIGKYIGLVRVDDIIIGGKMPVIIQRK